MTAAATLTGFRELEAALADLPKATGKGVLRRIAKGALEPMADAARGRAPKRSGALAYSIIVSERRTRRAKPSTTRFVKGRFRATAASGIAMAMGPSRAGRVLSYATFDEFGTVDTPAFGFMRGAWDMGAARALEFVKDNLAEAIAKAAARVAKRRAKAGLR